MSTIGRYRILGEVGRGELTVVYRALDPRLNRTVAIKSFPYQFEPGSAQAVAWQQSFQREVEAAGKLDHPNIVRLLDAGSDEASARDFVVMEFVEGDSLAEALHAYTPGTLEKLRWAVQMVDALATAHAQGIVHQHVRPSNILVTREGLVKVTDFGLAELARPLGESTPTPGAPRIHYRAPEQIYGKKADERTDIFATGVVLYEMLLGRRPFDGQSWMSVTEKILNIDPPYLKESSGEVPGAMVQILTRALAKGALDRHQSMQELLEQLRELERRVAEGSVAEPRTGPGVITTAEHRQKGIAELRAMPHLVVEEDGYRRLVPLGSGVFSIGRRNNKDLSLRDEHISRDHAQIALDAERYRLVDMDSKHGTFVNSERIKDVILGDGDRIDLGKSTRFRLIFRSGDTLTDVSTSQDLYPIHEQHMELLLEVSRALNSSLSVDDVLNVIIEAALNFTGAERGFVMLRGPDGRYLTRLFRHIAGTPGQAGDELVSTGVVERCLASERPVVIPSVDEINEFAHNQSILDLGLKSILCVPLIFRGAVLGVLYLDSRQLKAPFKPAQLELLMAFAAHAAIALENAHLYEMAIVDGLTGCFLRHHFDRRLQEEFERAVRHNSILSLLFMDIDHFKKINDTHGHASGDRVLRVVGQAIKAVARNTDIAARYGGEEFVLLAPETRLEAAVALAERIRGTVAAQTFSEEDASFALTISVGVACYPQAGLTSARELVKAADTALFQAKNGGRNRVCVSRDEARPPLPPAAPVPPR